MNVLDAEEFPYDCVFIKFATLPKPIMLAWCEIADGVIVSEKSDDETTTFRITPKPVVGENGELPSSVTPFEETYPKEKLLRFFASALRPKMGETDVADLGDIEDFRIQPGGQNMTKSVFKFMASYDAL